MPRELLILAITLAFVAFFGIAMSAVAGRAHDRKRATALRARSCEIAPATRVDEIGFGEIMRASARSKPYDPTGTARPSGPERTPENPYGYTEAEIATGYRTTEHGGHIESHPIPVEHILVIELRRVNATTALLRAEMTELRGRLEATR